MTDGNYRRMPLPQRVEEQQPPTPPTQPPTTPKQNAQPVSKDDFNERMDALAKSERERLQKERDLHAAIARLTQHERERGLLNNDHNSSAITNWIDTADVLKGAKGKFTVQTVDIAIDFLGPKGSNTLQWRKTEPQPVPVAEPEPVRLLPNGEPELPLHADNFTMRHASVEQLRDLSRRRGEGKKAWRSGWHGATL